MEHEEATKLLLAARVLDMASSWRKSAHMHIEDNEEFQKAIAADPLDKYLDRALTRLREVAARF